MAGVEAMTMLSQAVADDGTVRPKKELSCTADLRSCNGASQLKE